MTSDPQDQIEHDIAAFIDGQLDGERRFVVSGHLARHPDRAAEVMANLHLTEGLRLAVATVNTPPPQPLGQAADRLTAALAPKRPRWRWLPVAIAVAILVAGWAARDLRQGTAGNADIAAILESALDAQDAVALSIALDDRSGTPGPDPATIAQRLGIVLPDLPQGWILRAAQVVATPERPGVALVIDTPDLGELLLFGVLRNIDGPDRPAQATGRDGRALAFFERDRTAYVLVDRFGTPDNLRLGAETLRHRFN